jgi:DNA polymerase III epsilon subunit-like protein
MREYITNILYNGVNWIKSFFTPRHPKPRTEYFAADEPRIINDAVYEEESSDQEPLISNPRDEEPLINEESLIKNSDVESIDEIVIHLHSSTPKISSPKLKIQIPESKRYMFLDTETTGIPQQKSYNKYYEPYYITFYNGARMVELGYVICDDVGNIFKEQSLLIKPNGFTIKNSNIHGITTEQATNEGVNIGEALETLYADLQTVDRLICHNTEFDLHILLAECYREYQEDNELIQTLKKIPKQCTMEMGKKTFKLEKPPKLVSLYKAIFDKEPVQEHRALSDVHLCYDCYFSMNKS